MAATSHGVSQISTNIIFRIDTPAQVCIYDRTINAVSVRLSVADPLSSVRVAKED